MAHDITDPGPNGDHPYLTRNGDGSINTKLVPIGIERSRHTGADGRKMQLIVMPRLADGRPITDIAPLPAGQSPTDYLPR